MSTGRSYDRVAARYAAEVGDELRHKPFDRALLDSLVELADGGVIADIGCGPGHVAAYLRTRGARCVGLDLSPAMCALARTAVAADMTALPLRAQSLAGLVCAYAVIHLEAGQRATAYQEFARVLRPGATALIAFHTSDAGYATGAAQHLTEWWGEDVDLTFRYLDPDEECVALERAGLSFTARLDRRPDPEWEHASHRSYLLVRRP